jgi:predicted nucleic acid-binding protein
MKVYLDVCCLNRPFDDQSQVRIRLESEAIIMVFELFAKARHQWVISEVIEDEVLRNPNEEHRLRILALLVRADERLEVDQTTVGLARSLVGQGFGAMDALHVATAEVGNCDILLSTDDDLLRKVRGLQPPLRVRVENPVRWIAERARA